MTDGRLFSRGRRFAVEAVVPQNNRMLGAETVLPHFRTYDVTRANPQASFAPGAADPNTYCGQPCARAILLPLLKGAADNLVVQPQNRGTATATLYALHRLSELYPSASVAVFPSDHFVDNDSILMAHVDFAFDSLSECASGRERQRILHTDGRTRRRTSERRS